MPRLPVQVDRLFEDNAPEWRLHCRQCQHGLLRNPESALVTESLKDLLDHRKACHGVIQVQA